MFVSGRAAFGWNPIKVAISLSPHSTPPSQGSLQVSPTPQLHITFCSLRLVKAQEPDQKMVTTIHPPLGDANRNEGSALE